VTKDSSSSLGASPQHVELAKLRHVQVVGNLEGGEGMLFHEQDGVVLFADPLGGLEDDVDQHWRQTRQGRSGNSRLTFPFCISLASVDGSVCETPRLALSGCIDGRAWELSMPGARTRPYDSASGLALVTDAARGRLLDVGKHRRLDQSNQGVGRKLVLVVGLRLDGNHQTQFGYHQH
jgi:hypothetical protein